MIGYTSAILPHEQEVNIVIAKTPMYDTDDGRKLVSAMVALADLPRARASSPATSRP